MSEPTTPKYFFKMKSSGNTHRSFLRSCPRCERLFRIVADYRVGGRVLCPECNCQGTPYKFYEYIEEEDFING